MPKQVFSRCFLSLNSVNESASVESVELDPKMGSQETTTMGSGAREFLPDQLMDTDLRVTILDDFAAGQIDGRLWALFNAGTVFPIAWRPDNAAVGTSNPQYNGSGFITAMPIGGAVGQAAKRTIQIKVTGLLTRVTA